jgi:hypothetical protein
MKTIIVLVLALYGDRGAQVVLQQGVRREPIVHAVSPQMLPLRYTLGRHTARELSELTRPRQ